MSDPRGQRAGRIETHVRLVLANAPDAFSVLFVGVDEIGDAELGRVQRIEVEGRAVDFLPIIRIASDTIDVAARRPLRPVTLRFALGALRHLRKIRRAVGPGPATIDLHGFELAPVARLLGRPFVQMVHDDGSRATKADWLLGRLQGLHRLMQRHALRHASHVACVDARLVEDLGRAEPEAADKLVLIGASVDTRCYQPAPFVLGDGILRVLYSGRLDRVNDPGLMFETMRVLRERLAGKLEFHYLGGGDPTRYPEFAAVADLTIRHGQQDAAGLARILATCHAGILTSWDGDVPGFLLEGLATGRPFGAIALPCYDGLVQPEAGSRLVARGATSAASADALAAAFLSLWNDIRAGITDPDQVAEAIQPFTVQRRLGRLYALHRGLAETERLPPERRRSTLTIGPLRIERRTTPDVIANIEAALAGAPPLRIGFCNAHSMLLAFDRPAYADVLSRLTLLNDGIGATLAARLLTGQRFLENLNGTDFLPKLLRDARPALRIFLLGAKATVVAEAGRRLERTFPRHTIVGCHDGYFDQRDVGLVLDRIRAARPDLLLVAMGNPQQEEFMARYDREIACPVVMGVGGLFDFVAGAKPRAPRFVRALRCEWAFRLVLEPRRLAHRYTIGIVRFLWVVARMRVARALTPPPARPRSRIMPHALGEPTVPSPRPSGPDPALRRRASEREPARPQQQVP